MSAAHPASQVRRTTPALSASGLTRRFGNVTAVDGLDLELAAGEIFGLLGPNASGKTTTIRMLASILRPSAGSAQVLGLDLVREADAIKRRIGYVAQHFALYPELTAYENLDFYSHLYGEVEPARLTELLATYGLERFRDRFAGQLSGGYKRRLSIACALSHDPELVFLDEPTAGIDPVTRKELWDLFYDLATSGKTLFVTTHYMEEAERCHQLAFLSRGKRVASGSPAELRAGLGGRAVWAFDADHDPVLMSRLRNLPAVAVVNRMGQSVRLVVEKDFPQDQLRELLAEWPGAGEPQPVRATLEDVFIALTESNS
jgi:ABC-2 type transport system ATP-binding protein